MNKIIVATVAAVIGTTGVAFAQEAPQLIGNYSANVIDAHSGVEARTDRVEVDFNSAAAIATRTVEADAATGPFHLTDQHYSRSSQLPLSKARAARRGLFRLLP